MDGKGILMMKMNMKMYYSEIASKLDEIIPCEWERVVLYAEENGSVSSGSFYFYTEDSKYFYSENIWEEFEVDEDEFDELKDELMNIIERLWLEFKESGEDVWSSFTFDLNKDFKFKVEFSYEDNSGLGRMEKVLRWAYDYLGIVPKDNYRKQLLREYLEEQGKELPNELAE